MITTSSPRSTLSSRLTATLTAFWSAISGVLSATLSRVIPAVIPAVIPTVIPAAIAAAIPAAALAAPQADPVQRAVPAESALVVEFGGLAGCRQSLQDHGLAQLATRMFGRLTAAQRRTVLGPWSRDAAPRARQVLRRLELSPASLRELLQGPFVVAVGQRPTVASGVPMPSVAVLLEVGHAKASVTRMLTRLEGLGRGARDGDAVHGVPTRIVRFGTPLIADLHCAVAEGLLIVSNSRGYHAECLGAVARQQRSLLQNPHYQAARRHLHGRALGSLWVNTHQLMSIADPFLPYEMPAISAALGVGKLRGIYAGCGTDGGLGTEVLHIGLSGDPGGVLRAAFASPVDLGHAKLCSPDTVAFFTGRLDVGAAGRAVQRLAEILPTWLHQAIRKEGGRDLDQLHRVVRQLGLLDGQVTVALHAPQPLPIPEVLLIAGVSDGARVTQALVEAMRRLGGDRVEIQVFRGTPIHALPVRIDNHLGVVPSFAVIEGRLLVASHPHVLKSALRRAADADRGKSLWDNGDFQHITERARGSSMVGYIATGALASRVLAIPQVETVLRQQARRYGFTPDVVPDPEDLVDALGSIVITGRVDAAGLTLVSRSPIGEGSALAALGALLDWALRDLRGRDL